jgi:protein-S-isoprenylcysteine O-methyltransferase Ste14
MEPILTHVAGREDQPQFKWFRALVRGRTRVALAWIFAALLIFAARTYPSWPGILLCFIGATVRFWASGYLRKDTRPAVGGPYAFVRNPLYLGTYLMAWEQLWRPRPGHCSPSAAFSSRSFIISSFWTKRSNFAKSSVNPI